MAIIDWLVREWVSRRVEVWVQGALGEEVGVTWPHAAYRDAIYQSRSARAHVLSISRDPGIPRGLINADNASGSASKSYGYTWITSTQQTKPPSLVYSESDQAKKYLEKSMEIVRIRLRSNTRINNPYTHNPKELCNI